MGRGLRVILPWAERAPLLTTRFEQADENQHGQISRSEFNAFETVMSTRPMAEGKKGEGEQPMR